ncbi:hypothetical protein SSTU70S_04917 [Stutzerimonas stutzeri]
MTRRCYDYINAQPLDMNALVGLSLDDPEGSALLMRKAEYLPRWRLKHVR